MRLLIVGSSGFLGRNLVRMAPRDWEVYATYRSADDFPEWVSSQERSEVHPVRLDLGDEKAVSHALKAMPRPEGCIYLAADTVVQSLVENPPADVRNNIEPVANFVRHYRGGKLVYVSSGAVYMGHEGPVSPATALRPTIPYAISKQAAELYCQFGASRGWYDGCVVLRFFGAYGPYEPSRKITTKLVAAAGRRDPEFTIFGDGENLIDVMYVDDAVEGLLAAVQSGPRVATIDFAVGDACSLNEFTRRVGTVFEHTFVLRHAGESPEYIRFRASPDRMEEAFRLRPRTSLYDGMYRLREWLRSRTAG